MAVGAEGEVARTQSTAGRVATHRDIQDLVAGNGMQMMKFLEVSHESMHMQCRKKMASKTCPALLV